jgi:hypothetical protein
VIKVGLFSALRYTISKNKVIKKYSKELGKEKPFTVESLLYDNSRETLSEMFDYIINDKNVSQVFDCYDLTKEDLNDLYYALLRNGLGQWVKGHYVVVSVFFYPQTLEYAIGHFITNGIDSESAYRLLTYFKNEETGLIND